MKLGVIGAGALGGAIQRLFATRHDVFLHDPPRGINNDHLLGSAHFLLICVPTPLGENGRSDSSIVASVVAHAPAGPDLICCSTVAIGTTDRLNDEFDASIVYAPSYFGETPGHPYADLSHAAFVILGGRDPALGRAAELFKSVYPATVHLRKTTSAAAELVKLMINSYLALKVAFCNEIYDVADLLGLDFDEVRELWLLDDRIGSSHTHVYCDRRGFGGKCLPKDIQALYSSAQELGLELPVVGAAQQSNGMRQAIACSPRLRTRGASDERA